MAGSWEWDRALQNGLLRLISPCTRPCCCQTLLVLDQQLYFVAVAVCNRRKLWLLHFLATSRQANESSRVCQPFGTGREIRKPPRRG